MNLSINFTLEEFTASDLAKRKGIANTLPKDLMAEAGKTCQMMEDILNFLGRPIVITSGYRSIELNQAVGSSDRSDHVKAMAIDFKCPEFGTPYQIAMALKANIDALGIGQIIYEFGSWIHVSTRTPTKTVNRVITIDKAGTRLGIQK